MKTEQQIKDKVEKLKIKKLDSFSAIQSKKYHHQIAILNWVLRSKN